MDTRGIYNDPIIGRKRKGNDPKDPFKQIDESLLIHNGYALLSEIPNRFERVRAMIDNQVYYEVDNEALEPNTFRVDYPNGVAFFHPDNEGKLITFQYLGEGVLLFPDARIYLTDNPVSGTVRDKFYDIDRGILEQTNRVNQLVISTPQPSELVDIRIDYNGYVYPIARDRINAEQKKIEEAYVDAFGVKHDSLKERIDSMQIQDGNAIDNINDKLVDVWAEFELIPGKIRLEVGEAIGGLDQRVANIELLPERISLNLITMEDRISQIELLPDEINMMVKKDDIISSINLSTEGVAIQGDKIDLVGTVSVLSSISGDLGTINTGTINTLVMNGTNKQIYFGNNDPNAFEGRIDYTDPFIRLQRDSSTYYAIKGEGQVLGDGTSWNIHNMYIGGSSMFSFGYDPVGGHNHRIISSGNAVLKFLNSGLLQLQARNRSDDNYIQIAASDFITASKREYKTSIRSYDREILEEALSIPVRTYVRKSSAVVELSERYHLGYIQDEMPSILQRGDGIDVLSTTSYILKAFQEYVAESRNEIALLKQEIEILKSV